MSERRDTAALLADVDAFVRRFVVLPGDHFYDAVALWILHTHAIRAFDATPRLLVKSPEKESGKTRLLEVLAALVPNVLFVVNTTISVIYRLLVTKSLTLLHDEVDAVFSAKTAPQHDDLRAIINAGYTRSAVVARADRQGKHVVREYPVFAPMALAAIGNLPETIESRSVIIPMRRRALDEPVEPFRRRKVEQPAKQLREALVEWAGVNIDALAGAEPEIPESVTDRAADIWEPLIAIADLAGDDWPRRARLAAVEVVAGRLDEDLSLGVRLLVDIRAVMDGIERISSAELASALNELEESGWGAWHDGKGMNQRDLANRLRAYGIKTKNVRLPDGTTPKGYVREDFADTWARYLRDGSSATSATERHADPSSKRGLVADRDREREREDRRGGQQGLPFAAVTSATSATSATSRSKPVADRGASNGEVDPEYLDSDVLDAMYPGSEVANDVET